jgi:tetratricopeptide (TPR) repeat protein
MARGRDLEARTLYGPAMAEYQRAMKEDPANAAAAHYRIGVLSNKLGNTAGAVQEFRAALQLNPNHAEARAAVSAFQVKGEANVLMPPAPVAKPAAPRPAAHK